MPALGKRLLFANGGGKLGQFGMCMAQIIGFAPRLFDARFLLRVTRLRCAQGFVGATHGLALAGKAAECVEQLAVGVGADESAVVMLTVDLNKLARDRTQGLGTDRLIVDERAGAPVLHLDAAQNQRPVDIDVLSLRGHQGRMAGRQIEHGRNLPLTNALTDERAIAARPKRERKGIKQDGFTGAGLTRKHRQAAIELKIELFDQHDVADSELSEHKAPYAAGNSGCRESEIGAARPESCENKA